MRFSPYFLGQGLTLAITTSCVFFVGCGEDKKKAVKEFESAGYPMTPVGFVSALEKGDVRAIGMFVSQGTDLHVICADGKTPLQLAAEWNKQEVAGYLLDAGINLNAPDPSGRTPLMLAAASGHSSMVRYLLVQGAAVEIKDEMNRSALINAIDGNHPSCVDELAPYLRDQLDTALLYAAAQGKHRVIPNLTSFGASVYARHNGGMTALMLAAENGHSTTVYVLLDSGSNRYAVNEQGWTAAQVAAAAQHQALADQLNRQPEIEELRLTDSENQESVDWEEITSVDENSITASSTEIALGAVNPTEVNHASRGGEAKQTVRRQFHQLTFIEGKTLQASSVEPEQLAVDLRMRSYQQKPLPIRVEKVAAGSAQVRMLYGKQTKVEVKEGQMIPNTHFRITRIRRQLNHSKITDGLPTDVSEVEIEDTRSGQKRQLITQVPATAADPWAVLEHRTDGKKYAVRVGQTFRTATGDSYRVTDVRPTQLLLRHEPSGQVITIPLGR